MGLSRCERKHKNPWFCLLCLGKPHPPPITHVLPRCRYLSGPAALSHARGSVASVLGTRSREDGGVTRGGAGTQLGNPPRYPARPRITPAAAATAAATQSSARCRRQAAGSGGAGRRRGQGAAGPGEAWGCSPRVWGAVGRKGQRAEAPEEETSMPGGEPGQGGDTVTFGGACRGRQWK